MPSEIIITGIPELLAKVNRMQAVKLLTPPMVRSVAILVARLKLYPPRAKRLSSLYGAAVGKAYADRTKAGLGYIRTGHLRDNWAGKVDTAGNGLTGTINNQMPYGPYVMGPGPEKPKQAWMHVGIWSTTDAILEEKRAVIVADFHAAIEAALR